MYMASYDKGPNGEIVPEKFARARENFQATREMLRSLTVGARIMGCFGLAGIITVAIESPALMRELDKKCGIATAQTDVLKAENLPYYQNPTENHSVMDPGIVYPVGWTTSQWFTAQTMEGLVASIEAGFRRSKECWEER